MPNKINYIPVGTRNGDLEAIEYLGMVNGHSRVLARNVTNGVEKVITTGEFKSLKRGLLSRDQITEISRIAAKRTVGVKRPYNASHTWSDIR